jgi:hypothetical protein
MLSCGSSAAAVRCHLESQYFAAFVDQQAAEVHWDTVVRLARFRSGQRKTEVWILVSPAMTTKGVAGTKGAEFAHRVDGLYGCPD